MADNDFPKNFENKELDNADIIKKKFLELFEKSFKKHRLKAAPDYIMRTGSSAIGALGIVVGITNLIKPWLELGAKGDLYSALSTTLGLLSLVVGDSLDGKTSKSTLASLNFHVDQILASAKQIPQLQNFTTDELRQGIVEAINEFSKRKKIATIITKQQVAKAPCF